MKIMRSFFLQTRFNLKKKINTKYFFSILFFIIFALSTYTAYHIGFIQGKYYFQRIRKTKIPNPIKVPIFIKPGQIRFESRFKFTYDTPETLRELRESEKLDRFLLCEDDVQIALNLLHWARDQWEPGRPDPYPPINAKIILHEIRTKYTGGFCAQYNYVFVQALQSLGFKARYVTVRNHEVTEVWIKKLNKWVCYDPFFEAYYVNNGQFLSVFEIHNILEKNLPVNMIGNNCPKDIQAHLKNFNRFAVWLKNNHVSQPINFTDLTRYKIYFVETWDELLDVPPTSLFTTFIEDIYFPPS